MRLVRILLVIIAVACFGVALSYPIRYRLAQQSNNSDMEQLSAMRARVQQEGGPERAPTETAEAGDLKTDGGGESDGGGDSAAAGAGAESGDGGEAPAREGAPQAGPAADTAVAAVTGVDATDAVTEVNGAADTATETGTAGEVEAGTNTTADLAADADTEPGAGTAANAVVPETDIAVEADRSSAGTAEDAEPETDTAANAVPGANTAADTMTDNVPEAGTVGAAARDAAGTNDADARGAPRTHYVEEDDVAPWIAPRRPTVGPTPGPTPEPTPVPTPTATPLPDNWWDLTRYEFLRPTPTPGPADMVTPTPEPTPEPGPTRDRTAYTGAVPYGMKEKVVLDEDAILPELQEIYALNHDLAGWITIPDTVIDYPVVQTEDSEFYLSHDFYGEENVNGQIILDTLCDPYTPSYNLVISGHHMKNGSMFGNLPEYRTRRYWENHRFLEFDSLMERKRYVVFAAFYSADYDEDEEGFRYNANIEYKLDAKQWLLEVRENQLYDTGIDAEFGDEFITLTTCNRARHRNGRFVVVCRRIREGETFE